MKKQKETCLKSENEGGSAAVPVWMLPGKNAQRIRFHVTPRASKTELTGEHGGALAVRLQAPPVDGKANEALRLFTAEFFDVPKSCVRLVAGETAREKTMEIALPESRRAELISRVVFR